jgi:hypothetical protein
MQYLQGSGTPVLYIGLTVLKDILLFFSKIMPFIRQCGKTLQSQAGEI